MESYTITTSPSGLPVALKEAKDYLRVTSTYEDDVISGLIQAAVNDLEKYTGRWFMVRTALGEYDFLEVNKYEFFPYVEIRKSPLKTVNSVKVVQDSIEVAVDGTETKDNPIAYARELFTEGLPDYDSNIPRPLKISFSAGYGTSGAITKFEDNGSGGTKVTSVGHDLAENNSASISETTNYNGSFNIFNVITDTFDINKEFIADDATGVWVSGVPEDIKLAIKKHVAFNYKNRGPCDSSGIDLIKESISGYRIELGPVGCL
jgi:uncharacterized phiE125 gp8 family phage protein